MPARMPQHFGAHPPPGAATHAACRRARPRADSWWRHSELHFRGGHVQGHCAGDWRCWLRLGLQPAAELPPPAGCAPMSPLPAPCAAPCQAFRDKADALRASKMKIFVRRGGPNYLEGLAMMRALGQELGLDVSAARRAVAVGGRGRSWAPTCCAEVWWWRLLAPDVPLHHAATRRWTCTAPRPP